MMFSKLDLGSPITTSENIWMKRRIGVVSKALVVR